MRFRWPVATKMPLLTELRNDGGALGSTKISLLTELGNAFSVVACYKDAAPDGARNHGSVLGVTKMPLLRSWRMRFRFRWSVATRMPLLTELGNDGWVPGSTKMPLLTELGSVLRQEERDIIDKANKVT